MEYSTALERKLGLYASFSDEEKEHIKSLQSHKIYAKKGADLTSSNGDRRTYVILNGWVQSYKILSNGRRQVIDFHVPGDFLGLRNLLLGASDHCFEPVGTVLLCEIRKVELEACFKQFPRLAVAILWSASRDEAVIIEHLVNLGRRDALVRTAHFLLELGARLELMGIASRNEFLCPLTQYDLADALGISPIHLNRCLKKLRELGLLDFRKGTVIYRDKPRLISLSEFDAEYLGNSKIMVN